MVRLKRRRGGLGRARPRESGCPPCAASPRIWGVAPGTAARAYRELEASGMIETAAANGTFVAFDADPAWQPLQRAAAAFAAQVRDLRLDADEALAIVTAALRGGEASPAS